MKRAYSFGLISLLVLGALCLTACSSYEAHPGSAKVANQKRIFILSNQNDNNFLDTQIVAALKLRGYESECGPMTMMPDDTQVIVTYEDHWTWDFGDPASGAANTSSQQNPSHTFTAAGNFSVKLTVSNAGGSSQVVKVIAVP